MKAPTNLAGQWSTVTLDGVQLEVMQEKAATLSRVTELFEQALAAYRACGPDNADNARLRDRAAEALWHFVVQREACGLRNTEAVLREYAVPAELRLRMGVARQR